MFFCRHKVLRTLLGGLNTCYGLRSNRGVETQKKVVETNFGYDETHFGCVDIHFGRVETHFEVVEAGTSGNRVVGSALA